MAGGGDGCDSLFDWRELVLLVPTFTFCVFR